MSTPGKTMECLQRELQRVEGAQANIQLIKWSNKPTYAVVKTSKCVDFVIENEAKILQKLSNQCLHFCPIYSCSFQEPKKLTIKEITVDDKRYTLGDVIHHLTYEPNAVYNCMLQSIFAIPIHLEKNITHYDLHADNVMVTNTSDCIHVYSIDQHFYAINTFGLAPVFIDFGMSYHQGERFDAGMFHMSAGFTPCLFDGLVDFRLLFSTTSIDVKNMLQGQKDVNHKMFEKYLNITNKLTVQLNLTENGWFKKDTFFNVPQYLINLKPNLLEKEKGLFKHDNFISFLTIINHIMTVPLSHASNQVLKTFISNRIQFKRCKTTHVFRLTLIDFYMEWNKVEKVFRNTLREKLFLKQLVSKIDATIIQNPDLMLETILRLRKKYPTIFNFYRLLSSMFSFASAYFLVMDYLVTKIEKQKQELYSSVNIINILTSLPRKGVRYEKGSTLLFVKENIRVVLDDSTANMLSSIRTHIDENKALKHVLDLYSR